MIELAEALVEQDEMGSMTEARASGYALTHSAGKLMRVLAVMNFAQLDPLEPLGREACSRFGRTLQDFEAELDVLDRGAPRQGSRSV